MASFNFQSLAKKNNNFRIEALPLIVRLPLNLTFQFGGQADCRLLPLGGAPPVAAVPISSLPVLTVIDFFHFSTPLYSYVCHSSSDSIP